MLVLSRRIGERLVIDAEITITVIEVRGGQIRLGIEAPPEIPVWREEVVTRNEIVAVQPFTPPFAVEQPFQIR